MSNMDWLRSYGLVLPLGMILAPRECSHHSVSALVLDGGSSVGCVGNCPLRVDPNAATQGSGQSWQDPQNDVQAALDEQAAKGGGEVWVLGGEFATLQAESGTLLSIPSHVALRGGFLGSEAIPEERLTNAPATVLRSTAGAKLFQIARQNDVVIDRLRLVDGSPAFAIEDSEGIRISDLTIDGKASSNAQLTIARSDVRMERPNLNVAKNLFCTPMAITDADVAIVGGALESYYGALQVTGSRLLLQGVTMRAALAADVDSTALIVDSVLSETVQRGGVAVLPGSSALVGSLVTKGGATSAVNAGSLLVFNSSFVGVHSAPVRDARPRAAVIDASELRASASTFYDYACAAGAESCDWAIVPGSVDNSLFVRAAPDAGSGEPTPPDAYAMEDGNLPAGNCVSFDLSALRVAPSGDALAVTHPCSNGGDVEQLEASRKLLLEFAEPFSGPPFNADLSRYASPDWWRSETVLLDRSPDVGAPDPGEHVRGSGTP